MGKTIIIGALLFLCWHAAATAQNEKDIQGVQAGEGRDDDFDEDREDDIDEDDEVDESIELPYSDDNWQWRALCDGIGRLRPSGSRSWPVSGFCSFRGI